MFLKMQTKKLKSSVFGLIREQYLKCLREEVELQKYDYWKTIQITARMSRFANNARNGGEHKVVGPLTTEETSRQAKLLVKKVQQHNKDTKAFKEDQQQLNLKINDEGIYKCQGRIQGHYPVYQIMTY
jgi:hypothetical protein